MYLVIHLSSVGVPINGSVFFVELVLHRWISEIVVLIMQCVMNHFHFHMGVHSQPYRIKLKFQISWDTITS